MNVSDLGQGVYLVLMLVGIGGYFIVANRAHFGRMARQAVLWGLIFVAVIAAYGMWGDIRQTITPSQTISADGASVDLPRGRDGHYYAVLEINGQKQPFLVDTGASQMVLTRDAARSLGINPDALVYSGTAGTANGQVRTAPVVLDTVALGPVVDRNVRAMVNDGDLHMPLLGMSYLNRFSKIEIADGALRLTR